MSADDPSIAARFKAARLRAGLTQVQAAADLDTDSGTVSRWERGLHPIPAAALLAAEAWAPGSTAETPRRTAPAPVEPPASALANAPTPDADPSWWAGYLAAANETLRHAHAMIGGANQQIAHMLAHRGQWQASTAANAAPPPPELPADPDARAAALADYERRFRAFVARYAREQEAAARKRA